MQRQSLVLYILCLVIKICWLFLSTLRKTVFLNCLSTCFETLLKFNGFYMKFITVEKTTIVEMKTSVCSEFVLEEETKVSTF